MIKLLGKIYYPSESAGEFGNNKRSYYMDNLKFLLVLLVVCSHFMLKMTYSEKVTMVELLLGTFHMPCFVFTSGYFAKHMHSGGKLRVNKIIMIFWLYLFFKAMNVLLQIAYGKPIDPELFNDPSAPWYLFGLCIWYMAIPAIERIKTGFLLAGSVLIGLLAGYLEIFNDRFSMSRVLVFFPFFILGFCLSEGRLEKFLNTKLRIVAPLFLAAALGGIMVFWKQIKPIKKIVFGNLPYKEALGDLDQYGFFIRLSWYVLALLIAMAFMLLVPRCHTFFSVLGQRTLQIYMAHMWVRNALKYEGFFKILKKEPRYMTVLAILGCVVLTFVLANRLFKKLFDLVMMPKLFDKLIKNNS